MYQMKEFYCKVPVDHLVPNLPRISKAIAIAIVKRSNPEKNPRRYPEQKREKEWSTEESRIYRPLV